MNRGQYGMTIVELLVGMALGLVVLGAVTAMYLESARSGTHLLRSAQLNQQLRAVANLMVNDLRRAGYWGGAAPGAQNPFTGTTTDINIFLDGRCVLYTYDRNANGTPDSDEYLGFRLRDNKVWLKKSGTTTDDPTCRKGYWEGITTPGSVVVTSLLFRSRGGKCMNVSRDRSWEVDGSTTTEKPCDDSSATGFEVPQSGDRLVETRQIQIALSGQAKSDPSIRKSVVASVRVRNDRIRTEP